jgi:hypothetical protein
MRIRNIGRTSVEEFEVFKSRLISFIETLGGIGSAELNKLFVKLIISATFKFLPENFDVQFELLFDENSKLKLFALLKFLVDSDLIFNKTEEKIFQLTYTNQENGNINMPSIAEEQDLTEERVRQIKVELEKTIQSRFLFISDFPNNVLVNYGIDGANPFYIIDNIIARENNEREQVNFNSAFYGVILGIFIKNTHVVVGNNQVIVGEEKSHRPYKNCYLIKNDLVSCQSLIDG